MAAESEVLRRRKVADIVLNDVGLTGDVGMKISRALKLSKTNKVRRLLLCVWCRRGDC